MNRLSVRIFVAFFLTLLLVLAGSIAIATWTLKERDVRAASELQSAAEQAAQALALRGRTGLAQWAAVQQTDTKTAAVILIIDDLGIVAHEHETGIPLAADQVKTDSRHMSADEMKERNKRWGLFDPERQSIVVVCTGPMLAWDGSPEEYERFYPNAESGAPSVASPSNGD